MDVCVLGSLPIYVYQQTFIYQWDLPAGLVCQCLCMIMFDYVSQCVYINEIDI